MKKIVFTLALSVLIFSCKSQSEKAPERLDENGVPTKESVQQEINVMDDSLHFYYKQIMDNKATEIPVLAIHKSISLHQKFVNLFPKDDFAPEALDKMHQLYLQLDEAGNSVRIGNEIIEKYPTYKKGNRVMYSVATSYDYLLQDTVNARKYYEKLLASSSVSKETKNEIKIRLNYLGDSPEEMAQKISIEVDKLLKKKAVND